MRNPFHRLKACWTHEDSAQPFLEHVEALRQTLIRCLITVAIATLICIPVAKPIIGWLRAPLLEGAARRDATFELITTAPIEGFVQVMKVIFSAGVMLSLPLLIWFVGLFVLPGLKPKEQKVLAVGGVVGAILFAIGVTLCYTVSLPVAVSVMFYFNEYLGTTANWKIEEYLGFVMHLLIGFGLAFELPLVLILLGRMGLVSTHQLRSHRRHVFIGILVLAMLLTPPDIVTQLQMAIPLYLLYECCILILRVFDSRPAPSRKEESQEEGATP